MLLATKSDIKMYKKSEPLLLLLLILFCWTSLGQESTRPNIILILADDLGYSDLGCYGSEIKTPHLDNLAANGVRLANMNNAGMCVISRSSILTGKWWPETGYGIKKGENLAEMLKKRNYHTGIIGKWHLDGNPMEKGFDYFFGFLGGYSSYFEGSPDYRLNHEPFSDFGENFYSTDAFSEHAASFIKQSSQLKDKPFFLYLSYQSPHNPLQAPKEEIMKYRGQYLKGWESIRDARIRKQKHLGIVEKQVPLPGYPKNLPLWETLSPDQKDLEDLRMSVFAAMVEHMDSGIGKVIRVLEETGVLDNTLVLFLSDNGTDSFSVMDNEMLKRNLLPGDVGSNYQPGTGWAYASVAPNRLYKISQHNGGIKTGAIAFWPKGILKTNRTNQQPLHVVDIAPTLLELATQEEPKRDKENKDFSGQSFINILENKSWQRNEPMFFQFMDNRAIRTNNWGLVEVDGNGWELYDLKKDPLETHDLASKHPDMVQKLEKKWMSWWKRTSNNDDYRPESTHESLHYKPQGDRGSGEPYVPSAMPRSLKQKYPIDKN
ncbi:arylsulfatase [Maribacter algicola]|uniref:Arylsulfatase n=2 Tax=Maribacter algicola TaxID=2498892 RepID=A0A426RKS9_9FLAO|nr:arylsulfatase [Maribacter algicola]